MSFYNLWLNKSLRVTIVISFTFMQLVSRSFIIFKILFYKWFQLYLFSQFRLAGTKPNKEIQSHQKFKKSFLVQTSGSSGNGKEVIYTQARVRSIKMYFMLSILNILPLSKNLKTFFVLSSVDSDRSLTDIMTRENRELNRLQMLQAPYRLLHSRYFAPHLIKYDHQALKLWLFVVTRPRYLYATNPSSLLMFHYSLSKDRTYEFIRDFHEKKLSNQSEMEKLYHRIKADEVDFEAILSKKSHLIQLNPKLRAFICWDGGYVRAYLDELKSCYPNLIHYPLFSMSTENIETVSFGAGFYPLGPQTVYEFYKDDQCYFPWEITPGEEYEMLISNPYDLKRYLSGDIFKCRKKCFSVPDLVFQRRKGLTYSFTGEKLTAEQILLVTEKMNRPGIQFCFIPWESKPHYTLYCISDTPIQNKAQLVEEFDQVLGRINTEYASKRKSDRLKLPAVSVMNFNEFVTFLKGEDFAKWESQFKFLPLYPYPKDPPAGD